MNLTIKKYLKWSYVVILIIFGVVITALSGFVTYNDISSNPQYSILINTEYKTTEDLYIYGITMDKDYAKILDHYYITEVGFGGMEVLSRDVLKSGTLLKIKRVEKTTNFFIKLQNLSEIRYIVDISPLYENNQKTIYIDSDKLNTYAR